MPVMTGTVEELALMTKVIISLITSLQNQQCSLEFRRRKNVIIEIQAYY